MTVKLSVSLPDDVAAFLQQQGNVSGYVAEIIRHRMPDARRERMRAAVKAFAEGEKLLSDEDAAAQRAMDAEQDRLLQREVSSWE